MQRRYRQKKTATRRLIQLFTVHGSFLRRWRRLSASLLGNPVGHIANRISDATASLNSAEAVASWHPGSILVTSSRGCRQQVVRVGLVEFGERHDTRTDKQLSLIHI